MAKNQKKAAISKECKGSLHNLKVQITRQQTKVITSKHTKQKWKEAQRTDIHSIIKMRDVAKY